MQAAKQARVMDMQDAKERKIMKMKNIKAARSIEELLSAIDEYYYECIKYRIDIKVDEAKAAIYAYYAIAGIKELEQRGSDRKLSVPGEEDYSSLTEEDIEIIINKPMYLNAKSKLSLHYILTKSTNDTNAAYDQISFAEQNGAKLESNEMISLPANRYNNTGLMMVVRRVAIGLGYEFSPRIIERVNIYNNASYVELIYCKTDKSGIYLQCVEACSNYTVGVHEVFNMSTKAMKIKHVEHRLVCPVELFDVGANKRIHRASVCFENGIEIIDERMYNYEIDTWSFKRIVIVPSYYKNSEEEMAKCIIRGLLE